MSSNNSGGDNPIATPTTSNNTSPAQTTNSVELSPIASKEAPKDNGEPVASVSGTDTATTPKPPQQQQQNQENNPKTVSSSPSSHPTPQKDDEIDQTGEQIMTHQQLLAKARADLDQMLEDEEKKTKTLLHRREETIKRLWWVLMFAHIVAFLAPLLIWLLWFTPKTQVSEYHYSLSFFDLIIAISVRFVCAFFEVVTTRSDEKRIKLFTFCGYWSTAILVILNIAKLMVISWRQADRAVLACISMATTFIVFVVHHSFLPMDEENFDDDDEEKEAAAQRKKLHTEALQSANALSRRLQGDALVQLQESEAKRLRSYEYVEKMITRSHIQRRYESKVSVGQFLAFLRPYFWPKGASWIYHFIVIFSWILLLGSKACAIISPLYIGYAVNQLVDDNVMPWKNISIYVCIALLGQLLKQCQNAVYLKVKQAAFIEISSSLLRHILSLSHSYHHSKSLGKTVRGMDRGLTSADNVVSYLFLLVLPSVGEAIAVFVIFYTKFKSPLLAAIVFLHLIAYAATTVQMTLMRKPLRKRMTAQDNRYHAIFTEALTNFDLVRTFATEEVEIGKYTDSVRLFQRYTVAIQVTLALLNSIQQVIISSTLLTCLFVVSWEVHKERLRIGAVSSVAGYVASLYQPLGFLGTVYDMVISSIIDCRHILELRRIKPEIVDCENAQVLQLPTDGTSPVIEFKNLTFIYPGETGRGVRNVSLKLQGSNAIVGSTGSGKSTLLRLILRYYDPQAGEVLINGQNIKHITNQSLKDALTCIPQDATMFNTSILTNLKYGNPDATFEQVVQATKVAGIFDLINSFPQQFETVVGDSSKRLSGGERQRLSLARAILRSMRTAKVHNNNQDETIRYDDDGFPIIQFSGCVLADEYTSALDSVTERYVQRGLKKLEHGTTSIIIAHRLSTIIGCKNIVVMDDGCVIEQGSHSELMALNGKYAELWNIQFDPSHGEDDDENRDTFNSNPKSTNPQASGRDTLDAGYHSTLFGGPLAVGANDVPIKQDNSAQAPAATAPATVPESTDTTNNAETAPETTPPTETTTTPPQSSEQSTTSEQKKE